MLSLPILCLKVHKREKNAHNHRIHSCRQKMMKRELYERSSKAPSFEVHKAHTRVMKAHARGRKWGKHTVQHSPLDSFYTVLMTAVCSSESSTLQFVGKHVKTTFPLTFYLFTVLYLRTMWAANNTQRDWWITNAEDGKGRNRGLMLDTIMVFARMGGGNRFVWHILYFNITGKAFAFSKFHTQYRVSEVSARLPSA
jgi:hypothetical protein